MVELAPSILSADFWKLGEEIQAVERAGARWLHLDIMDGHFVPNLTIGPVLIQSLRRHTNLHLDTHLMLAEPARFVEAFAKAGSDHITIHAEADPHIHRTLQQIREAGEQLGRKITAGVSINPMTPLSALEEILPFVDLILLMSVNPGFGGQKFIPSVGAKAERLAEERTRRGLNFLIEIDGGVGPKNVGPLIQAGVDVVVAGSAVFDGKDPEARCREMLASMANALESETSGA